ncbi:MAG TPA: hypothetical protein VFE47_07805 [Tepidisphaeraceae bacterium]|nr:hypothetical protein [Tepidisphaeraceae bacterium]
MKLLSSDLTLCISLELALADSVAWAQRLAEKIGNPRKTAMSPV